MLKRVIPQRVIPLLAILVVALALFACISQSPSQHQQVPWLHTSFSRITTTADVRHDVSAPLMEMAGMPEPPTIASREPGAGRPLALMPPEPQATNPAAPPPARQVAPGSAAVEQTLMGTGPAPKLIASFEGLGASFEGPQGRGGGGNPSDNSLAVGPDHVVVTVNSRMAVFTKKGAKYDTTGTALYGPVNTNAVFRGFGWGGQINNGDAVVRYDQLANRWLIVMPIFRRLPPREGDPAPTPSGQIHTSVPGVATQPGPALQLTPPEPGAAGAGGRGRGRAGAATGPATGPATATAPGAGARGGRGGRGAGPQGAYAMCYAISTTSDPLGTYYRYEFVRPLFPDYPRPAVWPDGYYVPTSTGDNVIQKHIYVVDRQRMLRGEPATEQGFNIDGAGFLNNADLDGTQLPPAGAPNIMMAAGGSQLRQMLRDDGIYYWKLAVNWEDPSKTKLEGPTKINVAPYNYMGGGQLTNAVPQPGTTRGLDAQGDKIMSRMIYRRIGDQQSIVAVHSINTTGGAPTVADGGAGGGVRWYEFRIGADGNPALHQQGTYCPTEGGGGFRWMASPAMDSQGNIGIGYSFGGPPHFAGQRFAGRLAGDPLGQLTLKETILVEGEAAQTSTNRWEDYTATAVDPSDDRTIWYVGDYLKAGQTSYSSRIGAFRLGE